MAQESTRFRLFYLVLWASGPLVWAGALPWFVTYYLRLPPSRELENLTQPLPAALIWTTLVFLLYLFWGDRSEHHKKYLVPFQGIWLAFSLVTLLAMFNVYTAYQTVQDRLEATAGNKSLMAQTVKQLKNSTTSLLAPASTVDCATYQYQVNDAHRQAQAAQRQLSLAIDYERRDFTESPQITGLVVTTITIASKLRPLLQIQDVLTETTQALGQISTTLRAVCTDTVSSMFGQIEGQVSDAQQMAGLAADSVQILPFHGNPLFLWLGTLNTVFILFPWGLLLLFIYRKRDNRAKQIYDDLVRLDPARELLNRVLWKETAGVQAVSAQDEEKQAIDRLANQTFSNFEYVLNLLFLSLLIVVGWYFIFYPEASLNLTQLVRQGGGVRELTLRIIESLTPLTMGFAGAYFFAIQMLVRRYLSNDLYPSAYLQASLRLLMIFILSLALSLLPFSKITDSAAASAQTGAATATPTAVATPAAASPADLAVSTGLVSATVWEGLQAMGTAAKNGVDSLVLLMAFVVGIFPNWGVRYIVSWVSRRLDSENPENVEDVPLNRLDGVSIWTEERLAQRGIDNVQSMATTSIERLVVGTPFPTAQIVDWIDQAILCSHAGHRDGEWFDAFRAVGIRTASDLLDASVKGWAGATLQTRADFEPEDNSLEQIVAAVNAARGNTATPAAESAKPITLAILKVICEAIWPDPNIKYIINYYHPDIMPQPVKTDLLPKPPLV